MNTTPKKRQAGSPGCWATGASQEPFGCPQSGPPPCDSAKPERIWCTRNVPRTPLASPGWQSHRGHPGRSLYEATGVTLVSAEARRRYLGPPPRRRKQDQSRSINCRSRATAWVSPWLSRVASNSSTVFGGLRRLFRCRFTAAQTAPGAASSREIRKSSGCWASIPDVASVCFEKSARLVVTTASALARPVAKRPTPTAAHFGVD